MTNKDQRTEKPTEQRLKKAREEGRLPVSREFPFALQWLAFTVLATSSLPSWTRIFCASASRVWAHAASSDPLQSPIAWPEWIGLALPMLAAGGLIWLMGFGAHLLVTGFGFAPARLTPDFNRLNPATRLSELPRQNLSNLIQTILLLPLAALLLVAAILAHAPTLLPLSRLRTPVALAAWSRVLADVMWKAAWFFLAYGVWDLFRQRRRWTESLRMSRQEVKDEWKQQEGSPEIKMRIRRIRRDLLRRRMMSEVPKATAVIVNPTHYAVALRYQPGQTAAPRVVAKGKNYLAARIREVARQNQVPVVENPPLAQALYKAVEVGHEIPVHLYRAVAEILAYLYRVLNGKLPG